MMVPMMAVATVMPVSTMRVATVPVGRTACICDAGKGDRQGGNQSEHFHGKPVTLFSGIIFANSRNAMGRAKDDKKGDIRVTAGHLF